MQIQYTVLSCVRDEFPATATVAGQEIPVKIDGVVVEMGSNDGSMGHTFRFSSVNGIQEAMDLFVIGNNITVTFTAS